MSIILKILKQRKVRKLYFQLRGARKLRNAGTPFFVLNKIYELTEIKIRLDKSDILKSLVDSHLNNTEIILRQILLREHANLSAKIMQGIGKGGPVMLPLPSEWINYLRESGINCSQSLSKISLTLESIKKIVLGLLRYIYYAAQINCPKNPNVPYIVFLGLSKDNIPLNKTKTNSRDLISWFKNSELKKRDIKKYWVQAKVCRNQHIPDDIIVSQMYFPRFETIFKWLRYNYLVLTALFYTIINVILGKWWYGFLFNESVGLFYVQQIPKIHLAKEYYFNNSGWFYKPLWACEVEKKGIHINQIYYSVNQENIIFNKYKYKGYPGYQIMLWKRFIIWDQTQENLLRRFCPDSEYIKVNYVDISGLEYIKSKNNKYKKILAIFDVTPLRPLTYTKLGSAIPLYYSEELNLKFLYDIIKVFDSDKWLIYWKQKRFVGNDFISTSFKNKQMKIVTGNLKLIEPNISASSLIEASDGVISMPFSSPSVIADYKNIPSCYYDSLGQVCNPTVRGIPLIKNINDLISWRNSYL